MQSKKSFFNVTLFRKNLTRYWPLWGGLSIAGAFIPLYMILMLVTQRSDLHPNPNDFGEILYQSVTMAGPAFIMGYAIICAMLIWSYLYSPRAVGLLHTLPVSRTCLFITNVVSGLTMMAIPFAVVGGLLCLIALVFGFFNLVAVIQTVAAVIFLAVLFFGIATLCAMLTGHIAVLPVLYLLVNFLAEIVEAMVNYLTSAFLMGVPWSSTDYRLMFLTPVLNIYSKFTAVSERFYENEWSYVVTGSEIRLVGLGTVALYALAGVALLALSWLLYQKRQSERAGDIVAYRPLRPVFRYGVALLSALTLGQLLESAFWAALNIYAVFSDLVPMIVCMAIAGVIGYYIASMLLEKSLRVFKGSWKGVLVVCAGAVILCTAASLDPMGLENKIPALDDIERLQVYGPISHSLNLDAETDREMVEQILDIHQTILADKDYIYRTAREIRSPYRGEDDRSMSSTLWLDYTLKDGTTLSRYYTLPFYESRMKDSNTYDGKLYQLAHDEEIQLKQVKIPEGSSLLRVNVYVSGRGDEEASTEAVSNRIYEAILQDAREGHVSEHDFPYWEQPEYTTLDVWLETIYTVERTGNSGTSTSSNSLSLRSDMTNTIDALIQEGFLTQTEVTAMLDGTFYAG